MPHELEGVLLMEVRDHCSLCHHHPPRRPRTGAGPRMPLRRSPKGTSPKSRRASAPWRGPSRDPAGADRAYSGWKTAAPESPRWCSTVGRPNAAARRRSGSSAHTPGLPPLPAPRAPAGTGGRCGRRRCSARATAAEAAAPQQQRSPAPPSAEAAKGLPPGVLWGPQTTPPLGAERRPPRCGPLRRPKPPDGARPLTRWEPRVSRPRRDISAFPSISDPKARRHQQAQRRKHRRGSRPKVQHRQPPAPEPPRGRPGATPRAIGRTCSTIPNCSSHAHRSECPPHKTSRPRSARRSPGPGRRRRSRGPSGRPGRRRPSPASGAATTPAPQCSQRHQWLQSQHRIGGGRTASRARTGRHVGCSRRPAPAHPSAPHWSRPPCESAPWSARGRGRAAGLGEA
mmetsp:Transcript_136989/g.438243  ORF Transcript_136989/g.438243 Transcript_136989/m.438243 type:complete len:398 (+) Transcript_136989:23-1216(+)